MSRWAMVELVNNENAECHRPARKDQQLKPPRSPSKVLHLQPSRYLTSAKNLSTADPMVCQPFWWSADIILKWNCRCLTSVMLVSAQMNLDSLQGLSEVLLMSMFVLPLWLLTFQNKSQTTPVGLRSPPSLSSVLVSRLLAVSIVSMSHLSVQDFPLLQLDDVVGDHSNILGFSLLNSSHTFYLEFIRSLNLSWREGCRINPYPGPTVSLWCSSTHSPELLLTKIKPVVS